MILILAVFVGFLAGLIRAEAGKRKLILPRLRLEWLVLVAVVPQLLVFSLPGIALRVPDAWARVTLVASMAALAFFAGLNIRQPGFIPLLAGLGLNLLVIALNGGLMPIRPELLERYGASGWEIGQRMAGSKDIILPLDQTRLWFFSDVFTLPEWIPYRVAFSPGDVLISAGIVLFFWSLGGKRIWMKAYAENPEQEQKVPRVTGQAR